MKPADFCLHRPDILGEALALLAEHGDDAKALAGGQSLVPLLNFRLARPAHVIDLERIASLRRLRRSADGLAVGAMVRQRHAETDPEVAAACPLLAAALPHVGHPPIRNRGTIGGSLAHADPAAELPAVAVALDATLIAASARGRRKIPASAFYQTYLTTALEPDELLVETVFPPLPPRTGACVLEVSRRQGDFALVGVALQVTLDDGGTVADARVCFIGVAEVPRRCPEAEAVLTGCSPADAEAVSAAADRAREVLTPASDLHASADYRRDVAGTLLERAFIGAARRPSRRAAPDPRPR